MDDVIFISIPKTGTNTLNEILKTTKYTHYKAKHIRNILGREIYETKNTFCFIRNPYDLVKSWYYYHKFSKNVIRNDVKNFYPDTIEEWVYDMNFLTHWENKNHKKYNSLWDLSSPLQQKKFIVDEKDKVIVKNIYKFDNISEVIRDMFNINTTKIPCNNKSDKDKYPKLSNSIKKKIYQRFKDDFLLYESL